MGKEEHFPNSFVFKWIYPAHASQKKHLLGNQKWSFSNLLLCDTGFIEVIMFNIFIKSLHVNSLKDKENFDRDFKIGSSVKITLRSPDKSVNKIHCLLACKIVRCLHLRIWKTSLVHFHQSRLTYVLWTTLKKIYVPLLHPSTQK